MDIREILNRLRKGQSNRAVARALNIDRKTIGRYHTWAAEQGLLEGSLPSLGQLHQLLEETLKSPSPVAGFGYVARLGLLGGWCHLAAPDAPSVRRTWGENLRYGRRDGSR